MFVREGRRRELLVQEGLGGGSELFVRKGRRELFVQEGLGGGRELFVREEGRRELFVRGVGGEEGSCLYEKRREEEGSCVYKVSRGEVTGHLPLLDIAVSGANGGG